MHQRELISIHIGKTGVKTGDEFWNIISKEDRNEQNPFFMNSSDGEYKPRAIFIDLEPDCINEISSKSLYDKNSFMSGISSCTETVSYYIF